MVDVSTKINWLKVLISNGPNISNPIIQKSMVLLTYPFLLVTMTNSEVVIFQPRIDVLH